MQLTRRFGALLVSSLVSLGTAGCGGSGDCELSQIQPSQLPDARVGEPYAVQFSSEKIGRDCESEPTFELGEDRPGHKTPLPPGLALSLQGSLSGTPITAGSYDFSVWALIGCQDANAYVCLRRAPDANLHLTVVPR